MAKKIKMPLILNGAACRTIGELQANWDMEEIYNFFVDGKLLTWCQDRRYIQADKIAALSKDDSDVRKKICDIFEVEYIATKNIEDDSDWEPKDSDEQEKFENLKRLTDDKKILRKFRQAAFDRDELIDLLDEDFSEIYLCDNNFEDFPIADENKTYIGVGNAVAIIPSKEIVDFDAKNIKFVNVKFDDAYQKVLGQNSPKFIPTTSKTIPQKKSFGNQAEEFFKLAQDAYNNKKYSEAAEYYQKASDLGYVGAAGSLALMYISGDIGNDEKSDAKKVFDLFSKDAQAGVLNAMIFLADLYKKGIGTEQNFYKAFEWLKKPVEAGNALAMTYMADLYLLGNGVHEDKFKAFELYKKAAELGETTAMNCLAMMYLRGKGTLQEVYKAVNWLEKSAKFGNITAMKNLGYIYRNGDEVAEDKKTAFKWYLKAAEAGDAEAMNVIGLMYDNGENVCEDKSKAVEWYKKAADLGNTVAMCNLGYFYKEMKNFKPAEYWYKKAVDLGDIYAINKLGEFYLDDIEDYEKALKYFLQAADKGNADAMYNLSKMYMNGNGIKRDNDKAEQWLIKAAEAGHNEAKKLCNKFDIYYDGKPSDMDVNGRTATATVTIVNKKDIHARNASMFVQTASGFKSKIQIQVKGKVIDGKSLLMIMSMGLVEGDTITITAEGKDSAKAVQTLAELVQSGFKKGPCFITTAVCNSFNKPDDCSELTAFRNFRDNWLALQSDGKSLIEEYYKIAPQIVENINKLTNANEIYKKLWYDWLSPCLEFIKVGDNVACKDKYVEMVRYLKKLYF